MKKVINITIGHTVFVVEDDAFSLLESYLSSVKNALKNDDDRNEIMNDIEVGIAEKFLARGRNEKNAVMLTDVEAVAKEMGSAEAIDIDKNSKETVDVSKKYTPAKRLYRNQDDVVIAGVASGIAAYFGIDPLIVRVVFLVLTIAGGTGVWVYIVLWLLVPVAKTSSQKLEMYGEPVTLSNIRDFVDDTVENIKKKRKAD